MAEQPWYDEEKVEEVVLALLYLNLWVDGKPPLASCRAWKGLPWDELERLHEKGYISNPRSRAKSVAFTPEGLRAAREAFLRWFGLPGVDLPQEDCLQAHLADVPEEERARKLAELAQQTTTKKKQTDR